MKIKKSLCVLLAAICIQLFSGCSTISPSQDSLNTLTSSSTGLTSTVKETQSYSEIQQNNTSATSSILTLSEVTLEETSFNEFTTSNDKLSPLTVHFINVGQGDSVFIELNDETMLIDAGEWEYAPTVVEYISDLGYDTINYVVATHPHSDHIGGMETVFNSFNIGNVYVSPIDYDSKTNLNMLNAADKKAKNIYKTVAGDVLVQKDNLLIEAVAPSESTISSEELNNSSIVLKMTYGDTTFLFTGDAEKEEEDKIWTNIKADVLKVGHHGSNSSTTYNFLKKVEPKYAVISVGQNNEYGHPTDKVLNRLDSKGIKILRTDLNGTIVFTTNGIDIEYFCENEYDSSISETEKIETIENTTSNMAEPEYYVLNTRSKKIHRPDCPSVEKISSKNRKDVDDISGLIDSGYSFCQVCGNNN